MATHTYCPGWQAKAPKSTVGSAYGTAANWIPDLYGDANHDDVGVKVLAKSLKWRLQRFALIPPHLVPACTLGTASQKNQQSQTNPSLTQLHKVSS